MIHCDGISLCGFSSLFMAFICILLFLHVNIFGNIEINDT